MHDKKHCQCYQLLYYNNGIKTLSIQHKISGRQDFYNMVIDCSGGDFSSNINTNKILDFIRIGESLILARSMKEKMANG